MREARDADHVVRDGGDGEADRIPWGLREVEADGGVHGQLGRIVADLDRTGSLHRVCPLGDHPPGVPDTRTDRLLIALEWPMAVLALAVLPALVLEDAGATPRIRAIAHRINWFVWLAFVADYLIRLAVSPRKRDYVRGAWFDLAIIALSPPFLVPESLEPLRGLRALRLLRLVRVFSIAAIGLRAGRRVMVRQRLLFVTVVAIVTVLLGARAVFVAEQGVNQNIGSLADALWWSIVTATTVGYGDVSPVTLEGRVVAVLLMLVGIGVIGVFTATVASAFLAQDQPNETDLARVEQRMAVIEAKLDELLRRETSDREVVAKGRPRSASATADDYL